MGNKFRLDNIGEEFEEEQEINGIYDFKTTRNLVSDRTFCTGMCECAGKTCPNVCSPYCSEHCGCATI
ncbi:MAG: hypothetical protein WC584_00525 [Candidatus Pacearchaeota archaeon]